MKSDLLKLDKAEPIKLYEWTRDVSGTFHHWNMQVLQGHACLHIQGNEDIGYTGHIQLNHSYNPDLNHIFKSSPTVKLNKCARILENEWHKLISDEMFSEVH
jgi:hypothetical protein